MFNRLNYTTMATFKNHRSIEAYFGTKDLKNVKFMRVAVKKLNADGEFAGYAKDADGNVIYKTYEETKQPVLRLQVGRGTDMLCCAVSSKVAADIYGNGKASGDVTIVDVYPEGAEEGIPTLCYAADFSVANAADFLGL